MRRRSVILGRMRSRRRAEPLAWIVAFAVLVQTLRAAPVALRMEAAAALPDGAAILCLAHLGEGAADPAQPTPAAPHDHGQCLFCQGGTGPLLAAALVILASPPGLRLDRAPAPHSEAPRASIALAYSSRAPPLNA
jgi:hypothetical protein